MGTVGDAQLGMYICPPIADAKGSTVTGLFHHEVAPETKIYVIGFSDGSEIHGATNNHPFWSKDLQDFIQAKGLQAGSTVRINGGLTTVSHINVRDAINQTRCLITSEFISSRSSFKMVS
jgi:hypothetical protein